MLFKTICLWSQLALAHELPSSISAAVKCVSLNRGRVDKFAPITSSILPSWAPSSHQLLLLWAARKASPGPFAKWFCSSVLDLLKRQQNSAHNTSFVSIFASLYTQTPEFVTFDNWQCCLQLNFVVGCLDPQADSYSSAFWLCRASNSSLNEPASWHNQSSAKHPIPVHMYAGSTDCRRALLSVPRSLNCDSITDDSRILHTLNNLSSMSSMNWLKNGQVPRLTVGWVGESD